jgi:hypothetical protein
MSQWMDIEHWDDSAADSLTKHLPQSFSARAISEQSAMSAALLVCRPTRMRNTCAHKRTSAPDHSGKFNEPLSRTCQPIKLFSCYKFPKTDTVKSKGSSP